MPITDYTFQEENSIDRIFYGRIRVVKSSSFLFFSENGITQRLIHQLKYKNQEKIGLFFGNWYGQILQENQFLKNIDYVIPVPLHAKKLKKRGYNQVALFAERIAHYIQATYADNILKKTANTKTQTTKTRIGRWHDNKALYTVTNTCDLKYKNVLLVDDVITTGATMELCAQALSKIEGVNIFITSMATVSQFQ